MDILIVDDEQPARDRLRRLLEQIPKTRVIGEAANGVDAINCCRSMEPDIVLLDIRMPDMDGLTAARELMQIKPPPAIIFTTAYDAHALEAFTVHAVDYLLKPIRLARLQAALTATQQQNRAQIQQLLQQTTTPTETQHIIVKLRGETLRIPLDEICYLRAEDKYTTVCHRQGYALLEHSLKELEKKYSKYFLRVHRNALVAKAEIAGLSKKRDGSNFILLKHSKDQLEISRRRMPEIRKIML